MNGRVLNLLLTHQSAAQTKAMLDWWHRTVPNASVLLAVSHAAEDFGEEFSHIGLGEKLAVNDCRLRTTDHVRQRQSYSGLFADVTRWLADRPDFSYIHFAEFDHLPLVPDLNERQQAMLEEEGADVLGFGVRRVDGTSHSIWLSYAGEQGNWQKFFRTYSVRDDAEVVLSMFGSGSFWTRSAFTAVAAVPEPFPIYLELWLPTLAHHMGYRVRPFQCGPATTYISNLGDRVGEISAARAAGAWSIHPVKSLWNVPAAKLSVGDSCPP